jgi:hypothetical protein
MHTQAPQLCPAGESGLLLGGPEEWECELGAGVCICCVSMCTSVLVNQVNWLLLGGPEEWESELGAGVCICCVSMCTSVLVKQVN